jgi:hypothetical protein
LTAYGLLERIELASSLRMNAEAGAGKSSVLLLQSMSVDIGYDGRIDVPNLVEPQIPLHIIHKVVGITCN